MGGGGINTCVRGRGEHGINTCVGGGTKELIYVYGGRVTKLLWQIMATKSIQDHLFQD